MDNNGAGRRRRRITIRDVAEAAGVSTTTVSDALTGSGRLSEATRERVGGVAARLGYRANLTARNLRHGRSGTIGLYLPAAASSTAYYLELAGGAAAEALGHDLALVLLPPWRDVARVMGLGLDGLAVVDPMLGDPLLPALPEFDLPVVTVERDLTPGAKHAGRVEGDYPPVVRELLDHLAAEGARRIALISLGPDTAWGLDILQAYRDWCREGGQRPVIEFLPFATATVAAGEATLALLNRKRAPDAILCVPDGGAQTMALAVRQAGRRVPDDLLIASCVDSAALADAEVPVTALDIQPRLVGSEVARLLYGLIEGTEPWGTVRPVSARLIRRASTLRSGVT